jgi:uncharacterized membrane protein YphA (DoxX/SURF4 family)
MTATRAVTSVPSLTGRSSRSTPVRARVTSWLRADPGVQAFWALRLGFTVLPIWMGADKFAHVLTNWDQYFAPRLDWLLPGSMTVHQAMYIVGVIEIVAGLAVLVIPRIGSVLVAGWLAGIMVDLLLLAHHGDIVLRDLGLFLAAVTLARLSWAYRSRRVTVHPAGR